MEYNYIIYEFLSVLVKQSKKGYHLNDIEGVNSSNAYAVSQIINGHDFAKEIDLTVAGYIKFTIAPNGIKAVKTGSVSKYLKDLEEKENQPRDIKMGDGSIYNEGENHGTQSLNTKSPITHKPIIKTKKNKIIRSVITTIFLVTALATIYQVFSSYNLP